MKYIIGAVLTLLAFALIARAGEKPPTVYKLGPVTVDTWKNTVSFPFYTGYKTAKGYKTTATRKCQLDFTKALMTCSGKSYPFTQQEATMVPQMLDATLIKYVVESMIWFDAGGKIELPQQQADVFIAGSDR